MPDKPKGSVVIYPNGDASAYLEIRYEASTREIRVRGWYGSPPRPFEERAPLRKFIGQLGLPLIPSDEGEPHDWEMVSATAGPWAREQPDMCCATCGLCLSGAYLEGDNPRLRLEDIVGCPGYFRLRKAKEGENDRA